MKSSEVQTIFESKHEEEGNFYQAIKAMNEMIKKGELDLLSVLLWWTSQQKQKSYYEDED